MLAGSKKVIRDAIEARGFFLCRREVLPYGIDFLNDISRIASIMAIDIRTFFDVGAWHGQVSECALTKFPDAQVVAFEPNPECFAKLERLFANRRFSAHQIAISDADATGELFCNEGTRKSLVFRDADARSIMIKCLTVDSFCKQNSVDRVDVLKIDTEGADMAVLRGARETLAIRGVRFVSGRYACASRRISPEGIDCLNEAAFYLRTEGSLCFILPTEADVRLAFAF
jgi:FkbM family methyltransferase